MSRRQLAEAEEDAAMPEIDSAALASGGGASAVIFFALRLGQMLIRQLRIGRRLDRGRHIHGTAAERTEEEPRDAS